MDTKYISASHTVRDPEGISKEVRAEIQVTPSEVWDGELQFTVNSHATGREYINVSLARDEVQDLINAAAEWMAEGS